MKENVKSSPSSDYLHKFSIHSYPRQVTRNFRTNFFEEAQACFAISSDNILVESRARGGYKITHVMIFGSTTFDNMFFTALVSILPHLYVLGHCAVSWESHGSAVPRYLLARSSHSLDIQVI